MSGLGGRGRAVGAGGGIVGLIVIIAFSLLQSGVLGVQSAGMAETQGDLSADCRTGADANARQDCGAASSAVGIFRCPSDETYVIAHEYGHHVQHLLGYDRRVGSDRDGPQSGSVRLELQADSLARVWAANAEGTGFVEQITPDDIASGLDAAAAIGDDGIEQTSGGRVDPESFTHGTSVQRQEWFTRGYRGEDISQCDSWSGQV